MCNKILLLILFVFSMACSEKEDEVSNDDLYRFSVENQLDKPVANAAVTVDIRQLELTSANCNLVLYLDDTNYSEINQEESIQKVTIKSVKNRNPARREIPSQCDDLTGDGISDELFFLADFEAGQTLDFEIKTVNERPEYQQGTQAFLKVQSGGSFKNGVYQDGIGEEKVETLDIPNKQVQGSGWAHIEGPVWESDLVGYRIYLDACNRVDIFGKSKPNLILDAISENYHEVQPWGTDILKVSNLLALDHLLR